MKKTPWFPGSVKPVHVGVYETKGPFLPEGWYRKWDGKRWYVGDRIPAVAAQEIVPTHQNAVKLPWRGLAEKP